MKFYEITSTVNRNYKAKDSLMTAHNVSQSIQKPWSKKHYFADVGNFCADAKFPLKYRHVNVNQCNRINNLLF